MTPPDKRALGENKSGFSLTEILVVLALLGILLSIAGPSFHSLSRSTPISIAREVLQLTQMTRLAALKTGTPKTVIVDAEAGVIKSEAKTESIEVPQAISFSITFARDDTMPKTQGSIIFFPDGSATGGEIRFQAYGTPEAILSVNWLTGVPVLAEAAVNGIR